MLDQLRERVRYLHYSLRTEEAYVHWVRAFIRYHGLRHPGKLGATEVEAFLSWLANERGVAASTHRQALSALLFFYGKVLQQDLPWMREIGRPHVQRRLPVVLTQQEVAAVPAGLERAEHRVLGSLLYGTGLRITEALQLRVKDVDFDHGAIVVRDGKGGKDRVVMLPKTLEAGLRTQLSQSQQACLADRDAGAPPVFMLGALARTPPPRRKPRLTPRSACRAAPRRPRSRPTSRGSRRRGGGSPSARAGRPAAGLRG